MDRVYFLFPGPLTTLDKELCIATDLYMNTDIKVFLQWTENIHSVTCDQTKHVSIQNPRVVNVKNTA